MGGMMKALWKGSLTFGLVNIPVQLFSAVKEHSLGFTLLHDACLTPINYQRWCSHCDKVIEWQDVVKGIKLANDSVTTSKLVDFLTLVLIAGHKGTGVCPPSLL